MGVVINLANPLPLEQVYEEVNEQLVGTAVPAVSGQQGAEITVRPQEQIRIDLRNYAAELLTREAGTPVRADLGGWLAAGRNVIVNLEGVEDLTPSFADEAFGKLSEVIGPENFVSRVTFEAGAPKIHGLIKFVLRTRQRRGSQ